MASCLTQAESPPKRPPEWALSRALEEMLKVFVESKHFLAVTSEVNTNRPLFFRLVCVDFALTASARIDETG